MSGSGSSKLTPQNGQNWISAGTRNEPLCRTRLVNRPRQVGHRMPISQVPNPVSHATVKPIRASAGAPWCPVTRHVTMPNEHTPKPANTTGRIIRNCLLILARAVIALVFSYRGRPGPIATISAIHLIIFKASKDGNTQPTPAPYPGVETPP